MFWEVIIVRFFKIAVIIVGAVAIDYTFFQGRTTRQVMIELDRAGTDAGIMANRLARSILNFRFEP